MKKFLFLAATLLMTALSAVAATVTPDEALARLSGARQKMAAPGKNGVRPSLVMTATTDAGTPAVYIFNRPDDDGYMLLSADDEAYPLLGYADSGSFDAGNIPPAMQWLIDEYARQIRYAAGNSVKPQGLSVASAALKASRSGRQAIAPMIATDWDQTAPYNEMCPQDGLTRTYTGCVATAMAQVMNYWKYPERGEGTITYTSTSIQKRLSLDFSARAFDWDNMLDTYYPGQYNQAQADAVAYLMKACGYSVKMDYGTDSSGALAMMIRQGLVRFFNYDGNAVYDLRMFHSATEWEQMIYDNLKDVGPILYGGASTIGGGHSFICDGYDGEGYFHFNWGWTGMSNGYFSLDALNPDALGSGGGGGGGYNFTQDAVFGIQPPTGKPVVPQPDAMTQMGSLYAEISNGRLVFDLDMQNGAMWVNYNPSTLRFKVGACFRPQGTTPGETVYCDASQTRWQVQSGYGFEAKSLTPIALEELGLSDGTYKVSVVTMSLSDPDADWIATKTPYGYYDYVVLTKKGDSYSVENFPAPSVDITDGGFEGNLYYGCVSKVWAELNNPYDIEVTTGLAPVLAGKQTLEYLGKSVLVTVPPHSSKKVEWTTPLYALQQQFGGPTEPAEYVLSFMDEISMLVYSSDITKPVTMYPNPGVPNVTAANPEVTGAKRDYVTSGGLKIRYTVEDASAIEVSSALTLNSGYFAYPVMACLCSTTEEADGSVEILTYAGKTMFLEEGRTPFSTVLSYPAMEPGKEYYILMAYEYASQLAGIQNPRPVIVRLMQSGVEDVAVDSDIKIAYDAATASVTASAAAGLRSVEAYNINGALIASATADGTAATLSLEKAPRGFIIVTARDTNGNARTIKIAR